MIAKNNKGLAGRLSLQESGRTACRDQSDPFIDLRMKWRASMMRHLFHILPGQKILEIGAGNGKFTRALNEATRGECKITAAVFSRKYQDQLKNLSPDSNIDVCCLESFPGPLCGQEFDCIVADHMLEGKNAREFLKATKSLLKPGGGLLLYEANSKAHKEIPSFLSETGYAEVNALPYDFLYRSTPKFLLWPFQQLSVILENFPGLKNLANSLCIWAVNPALGSRDQDVVDLSEHSEFLENVSFVIPCHNEQENIIPSLKGISNFFGKYIFEVIVIDDNSTDKTFEIVTKYATNNPRIRLIKRSAPNGVGRALRDGLNQAKGKYVLIMDSDFQHIIPEMRDLFDAIAKGADVAVGSRFSRESILVNYPFTKIIANRIFHLLANLLLNQSCRDISNNLKLFRSSVAKKLIIESDDFAANAETGLKPILLGYKVMEVPTSWVDRSADMGFSTFKIFKTGPNYFKLLSRLVWRRLTNQPCQRGLINEKQT